MYRFSIFKIQAFSFFRIEGSVYPDGWSEQSRLAGRLGEGNCLEQDVVLQLQVTGLVEQLDEGRQPLLSMAVSLHSHKALAAMTIRGVSETVRKGKALFHVGARSRWDASSRITTGSAHPGMGYPPWLSRLARAVGWRQALPQGAPGL